MNDFQTCRSLQRPLSVYLGVAAVMIAVSHGLTILMGLAIDVPIMTYGILTGVICGLAIWTTFGPGRLWLRFGASVATVVSLSLAACCLWNWLPRSLFRGFAISFYPGGITLGWAAFQSALGFLFAWVPLQAASIWFGWWLDQSCDGRPLRDGRRLRKRLLAAVVAVLMTATVVLRAMEHAVVYSDYAKTVTYVSLFPQSAMFGLVFVALVWGWLVANRLRYTIVASIPYLLLFLVLFVGPSGVGGLNWLIHGTMLLHAIYGVRESPTDAGFAIRAGTARRGRRQRTMRRLRRSLRPTR